jgi:hypothetical protein
MSDEEFEQRAEPAIQAAANFLDAIIDAESDAARGAAVDQLSALFRGALLRAYALQYALEQMVARDPNAAELKRTLDNLIATTPLPGD